MALTALENTYVPPWTVSSFLGKLEARRQRMAACAWTAGAAPAASTPAVPACLMMERRCMRVFFPCPFHPPPPHPTPPPPHPLRPPPALPAQDPAQGRSIFSASVASPIRCRRLRAAIGAQRKAHRAAHTELYWQAMQRRDALFDGQRRPTDDR